MIIEVSLNESTQMQWACITLDYVDEREERLRGRECDRVLRRERKKAYKDKGWISDTPTQIAMYLKFLYIHVQLFQF